MLAYQSRRIPPLKCSSAKKTTEYRSWQTKHRGDLLICSTAKKIKGTIPGHALIVCRIKEIKQISEKEFAWELDDFRDIMPFPVKGQQRLFHVPDEKIKFITYTSDEEVEEFVDNNIMPLFYK